MFKVNADYYVDWEQLTVKLNIELTKLESLQHGYGSLKNSLVKIHEQKREVRMLMLDINQKLSKTHDEYVALTNIWFKLGGNYDNLYLMEEASEKKRSYNLMLINFDADIKVLSNKLFGLLTTCEKVETTMTNFKALICKQQRKITKLHAFAKIVSIKTVALMSIINYESLFEKDGHINHNATVIIYTVLSVQLNIRHTVKRELPLCYYCVINNKLRKSSTPLFNSSKIVKIKEEEKFNELFAPRVDNFNNPN